MCSVRYLLKHCAMLKTLSQNKFELDEHDTSGSFNAKV